MPAHRRRLLAAPRVFRCRCGRPVFFDNSACLACGTALGFDPETSRLLALDPGGETDTWRAADAEDDGRYRRCRHAGDAAACNWLVPADAPPDECRSCRLNRTVPAGIDDDERVWWGRIEASKRRLAATLIALGLPLRSRVGEDPEHGVAFDLLRARAGAPPVTTGHADGIITLDVEEADDPRREQRRTALHEPYRTLLGHLRHEIGHYYWMRLVQDGRWLGPFRDVFGDEREDYAAALKRHYEDGPPAGHEVRYISAYASSHPWEDWAETWAHYLHLVDTLDTATGYGLRPETLQLPVDPFDPAVLGDDGAAEADGFLRLVDDWVRLSSVLNELNRAMGQADFYPFVMPAAAVRKLHLVHRVVRDATVGAQAAGRAR